MSAKAAAEARFQSADCLERPVASHF
jgi:hypothetical protein